MCKELMYKILYCKKLDWLKREKDWKLDRIDFIGFGIFVILLLLVNFYGTIFLYPFLFSFIPISIIGEIRQIKNTPGDIESSLMYPLKCGRYIFLVLWTLGLIVSIY